MPIVIIQIFYMQFIYLNIEKLQKNLYLAILVVSNPERSETGFCAPHPHSF